MFFQPTLVCAVVRVRVGEVVCVCALSSFVIGTCVRAYCGSYLNITPITPFSLQEDPRYSREGAVVSGTVQERSIYNFAFCVGVLHSKKLNK